MSVVFEVNSAFTTLTLSIVVDSASEVAAILAVKDSPATVVLFGSTAEVDPAGTSLSEATILRAADSLPVVFVFGSTAEVDLAGRQISEESVIGAENSSPVVLVLDSTAEVDPAGTPLSEGAIIGAEDSSPVVVVTSEVDSAVILHAEAAFLVADQSLKCLWQ